MTEITLEQFEAHHKFFIGIDSDGCVFDSMELKHKECFTPDFIKHWELQAVSRFAREAWDFSNLYSKWRGQNRFLTLVKSLELLDERPESRARGYTLPDITALREWIASASALGEPTLRAYMEKHPAPVLDKTLAWSQAVNATIAGMVANLPPFPNVRDCLEKMAPAADVIVVSATPFAALVKEWRENRIDHYPAVIAGQEQGNKKEHLRIATDGRYATGHVLMIGDAPGDMSAARANHALFFPINPGAEEDSWKFLLEKGLDAFLAGEYAGAMEDQLIADFEACLPENPPWK